MTWSRAARLQLVTIAYSSLGARCLQCFHPLTWRHAHEASQFSHRGSRSGRRRGSRSTPSGLPPGGRFDLDDLAILLDLDAYQKGEVERVLTEQRAAVRAAREAQRAALADSAATEERASRDEMRAQREQSREELFGKLQNTLTEL